MSEAPTYSPGLAGVIAGESAISCIDVERNKLNMRGYDLVDLTEGGASFEEVAYLLLHDDLLGAPGSGFGRAADGALTEAECRGRRRG